MSISKVPIVAWLLCLLAGCAHWPLDGAWVPVRAGVAYQRATPFADSVLHIVRVDLTEPGLAIRLTPEREAGRTIDRFAGYTGAVVAINASFFSKTYVPRGATRSDGVDWAATSTPEAFPVLACRDGVTCAVLTAPPAAGESWDTVVAGIPALLAGGVDAREALCAPRRLFCDSPHPRTAVGLDAQRKTMWIVTAEGRHGPVAGISLAQLTDVFRQLGAAEAINLDGGGSTSLSLYGDQRMQRPDNEPALRVIGNALLVEAAPAH